MYKERDQVNACEHCRCVRKWLAEFMTTNVMTELEFYRHFEKLLQYEASASSSLQPCEDIEV
jgi:hypothetical protein